jgi:hypothetical protein
MKFKTRVAYGKHKQNGNVCVICADTVEASLKNRMMVKDFEKQLARNNPEYNLTFRIEER